jgi:hypothetical protein
MGVVIEICVKCPGGRTLFFFTYIPGYWHTDITYMHVCYAGLYSTRRECGRQGLQQDEGRGEAYSTDTGTVTAPEATLYGINTCTRHFANSTIIFFMPPISSSVL